MDPQIVGGLLGFVGGILSSAITTWAVFHVRRSTDRALEVDEIRRRKVEIIYQLLGSRYVLIEKYLASPAEVQVFNTAMALFSVYFKERELRGAYDKFITSKTDDNLIDMLKAAAKTADLDLLDSSVKQVMVVNPRLVPLAVEAQYTGNQKPSGST